MTKTKSTKRALFMSFLSLLLCVSMLVGTTFAWFTDNVASNNNIIKAGNLDLTLEYWDGDNWEDVQGSSKILDPDALYEPGYVQVVYLKLANAGTLALKYQLGINILNEKTGTNQAGDTFKLSDYIQFGIVEGVNPETAEYKNRKDAVAAVTSSKIISAGYGKADKLLAGNSLYLAMVVYMPETVDNKANHNGKDIPSIELGINAFATQYTYEEDSFDNLYDEASAAFTVAEANALMAKGKDATLVNCNEPEGILTVPAGYTGTLTLVNSTVKSVQGAGDVNMVVLGDVVVNAKGTGVMLAAEDDFDGSAISANGKLTITGKGNLTAVAADVKGAFGIGGMNATEVTVKGITIDYVSGAYVQQNFINDTSYGKSEPEGGAAIGSGRDKAVITLDGVTIEEAYGGSKAAGIGARYWTGVAINIKNSVINKVVGGNASAGIGGSRVSSDATDFQDISINIVDSSITAFGGQFGAGIGSGYDTHCAKDLTTLPKCDIQITGDSVINATGGKYGAGIGTGYHTAGLSGFIADTVEVKAVGGGNREKYTAAMDVGFGVFDMSKEGSKATASSFDYQGVTITVKDAPVVVSADKLADAIKDDATVVLVGGDYTLPSLSGKKNVTIIGAADGSTKLAGVNSFNFGENTTIKNVTFKSNGDNSVRYGTTSGDVVYENCVFEGRRYGYHVDNANDGTITFNNCTFYGRNAFASSGTYFFNGCAFKYTYSNYNTTNIYSEATFNKCKWDSKLELYIESGAKAIIDSDEITQRVVFIADASALESFQQNVNWRGNTYAGVTVMLSANIDMKDAYYANWTPIGQTGATQFQGTFDGHGYTIKNLNVDSSAQTGAHYSSGLFGWLNNATVKNLTVENATVKGNHNVGVIAGYMETAGCTISNCHVIGATVVGKHANGDACGDKVGVIVGHAGNAGVKVENCSAKGCTVTAGRDAGQIVGAAKEANVTGCTAENVSVVAGGDCPEEKNIREEIIGRVL